MQTITGKTLTFWVLCDTRNILCHVLPLRPHNQRINKAHIFENGIGDVCPCRSEHIVLRPTSLPSLVRFIRNFLDDMPHEISDHAEIALPSDVVMSGSLMDKSVATVESSGTKDESHHVDVDDDIQDLRDRVRHVVEPHNFMNPRFNDSVPSKLGLFDWGGWR